MADAVSTLHISWAPPVPVLPPETSHHQYLPLSAWTLPLTQPECVAGWKFQRVGALSNIHEWELEHNLVP